MSAAVVFERIDNFRDFGGYAAGTRRVKKGLLYRSANHANASDADLRQLAALGLRVIVDLRRRLEREQAPSRRWEGFDAAVVETDIEGEIPLEWPAFLAHSDLSEASFRDNMLSFYATALHGPRHVDIYRRYFKALANTRGPMLVHCAGGKDRTGVICALTQHVLGVHSDDIVAEYLLTNDAARIEPQIPVVQELIFARTGRRPTTSAVRAAITVVPAYLEGAFETMRSACGSIDAYLDGVLGVGEAQRERLRSRLLD